MSARRLRIVTHAQRYDRPGSAILRAIRKPLDAGVGLGVLTETTERRHLLDRVRRIGRHSAGDCTIWWRRRQWRLIERARVVVDLPYRTERGRPVARTDCPVVVLERRRDGLRVVVAGLHLPRGIEHDWIAQVEWSLAAKAITREVGAEVDRLAVEHDADARVISGDWNLDLNRPVNRDRLSELLPGYSFGPDAPGTHGRRRIDGPAVAGARIVRHSVTPTPRISDHDRIVTTIQP